MSMYDETADFSQSKSFLPVAAFAAASLESKVAAASQPIKVINDPYMIASLELSALLKS